ncbi:MAG: hypothetical protein R6W93_13815 [Candidatus Limnocylindrales bacterium]
MIRQRFDARRTPRGFVASALALVATIATGPAALAQSPSASPTPSADTSPAASSTPTVAPFPWPTLPPPSEVPLPARFEPNDPPDATTTKRGIRVDLWLSSPTAAPGEWIQAVVRTTNLRDTTAWSWSGECLTSGTRVAVDLAEIIPPGETQTGNAAAFKRQALRWTTTTGFAPRRSIDDWYASADSGYAFVECMVQPGPLKLKAGATRTERFAWYPYDSFDGDFWLQPLPPGPVTVTASWPYLSHGERPSMSSRRAYRTMKPVKATTELEVTGDGPGTPSLPELIDIALADPEFRAWVDLEPGRDRWCDWCVSVTGWPGPTYERHLYLSHLGDTRPNGVLDLELDQRKTRGIIILDPWTGEVIDVLFLGGPGASFDGIDVQADPQAQVDRSAVPSPSKSEPTTDGSTGGLKAPGEPGQTELLARWGPLAVIEGGGGPDARTGHGTLSIGADCVSFTADQTGEEVTLVWGSDRTSWRPQKRQIVSTAPPNGTTRLSDGDRVWFGGMAIDPESEVGVAWLEGAWVQRPALSCPTDQWYVGDVNVLE